jgi:iron complex transport system substrate-binding protein
MVLPVRIASLVPSATEMMFALGLGDSLVAVTHECDYPPEAADLPHLTRSVMADGLASAEIDREVRQRTERGEALYELDHDLLHRLDPELIVTQAVCEVCAVSFDDVRAVAEELPSQPKVISLDPTTLGEVLADVRRLGVTTGVDAAAEALLREAADRLDRVQGAVEGARRPRVAALEWLDPIYIGGHWVPQMIEMAGGEDVLGLPGEKSRRAEWSELESASPDLVLSIPCGYGAARAAEESRPFLGHIARIGAGEAWALDASAYFSRPGPRLVDGVELLGHVLHPDRVPAPANGGFVRLDVGSATVHG